MKTPKKAAVKPLEGFWARDGHVDMEERDLGQRARTEAFLAAIRRKKEERAAARRRELLEMRAFSLEIREAAARERQNLKAELELCPREHGRLAREYVLLLPPVGPDEGLYINKLNLNNTRAEEELNINIKIKYSSSSPRNCDGWQGEVRAWDGRLTASNSRAGSSSSPCTDEKGICYGDGRLVASNSRAASSSSPCADENGMCSGDEGLTECTTRGASSSSPDPAEINETVCRNEGLGACTNREGSSSSLATANSAELGQGEEARVRGLEQEQYPQRGLESGMEELGKDCRERKEGRICSSRELAGAEAARAAAEGEGGDREVPQGMDLGGDSQPGGLEKAGHEGEGWRQNGVMGKCSGQRVKENLPEEGKDDICPENTGERRKDGTCLSWQGQEAGAQEELAAHVLEARAQEKGGMRGTIEAPAALPGREEHGGSYCRGGRELLFLNCQGGEESISAASVACWREAFPHLDMDLELAGISVWLRGHFADSFKGGPLPGRQAMENYIANCLRQAARKKAEKPRKKERRRASPKPARLDAILDLALSGGYGVRA